MDIWVVPGFTMTSSVVVGIIMHWNTNGVISPVIKAKSLSFSFDKPVSKDEAILHFKKDESEISWVKFPEDCSSSVLPYWPI